VQGYFGEGTALGVILQISMVVFMVGGILGANWLVNTLKTRFTYPRTGYVEYRARDRESNQRRYIVMGVALALAVGSIVLINYIRGLDSMVLGTGILIAAVFIALQGKSSGVTRFFYLGGLSFALGIGLSLDSLSQAYNLAVFYGLLGMSILISGVLVLRRYLSEHPLPAEDENE